ncbi:conserved protein of unknown function [Xenorhabdus poinarii G6]|uniref:Uncharacterized protein n=1 Tax=Xenorhabdus poinarii G6 TaxID=1354304 RepID=A0A068R0I5_9GAMM|nr:hypothetical protein [Xenorhabdus poinarii]CDG20693.1 conserved protein of unknown function [Xenorhabdus poinarii G6]
MRPAHEFQFDYVSLKNGDIDLADIALMNDYLDVNAENEALIARWKDEQ